MGMMQAATSGADAPSGRGAEERGPAGSRTSGPEAVDIAGAVEAVLLVADRAVPEERLAVAAGLLPEGLGASEKAAIAEGIGRLVGVVESLNAEYDGGGRAFRIERVAGGYRLMTRPAYARCIASFQRQRAQQRLSKAAVETLAIIAYRQPVTRAEVEGIRGVACGEVLKTLMEHRLITIQGRAEELGRPILYGTTRQFLDTFGLASLKDLPPIEEQQAGGKR